MRLFCLCLVVMLLATGCGTPSSVPSTPQPLSQEVDSVEEGNYRNIRFGYTLSVSGGQVLYALTDDQTAIVAQEDSQVVFAVEDETNFFTVRGIEDARSPHEWLTQNLSFFYPTGDAAQQVEEFAGSQAIFLSGSGTSESPARLIVFQLHGQLIVISYERETFSFEELLQSFRVI